jgi:hypothetical protein
MRSPASLSLAAILLLATACSSSSSGGPTAKIIPPTLDILQIVGPPELGYPEGPMEVKYEFRITNNSSEPITLQKVQVSTSNPSGGAYRITRREYFMKQTIAPNSTASTEVWVRAYGFGRSMRENEPVTLKGVASFSTPVGSHSQFFIKELGQYPGQNER